MLGMDGLAARHLHTSHHEGQGGGASPSVVMVARALATAALAAGPHRRQGRREPFNPGFTRQAMRQVNEACPVKGITPHRLRGTFATSAIRFRCACADDSTSNAAQKPCDYDGTSGEEPRASSSSAR